MSIALGWGIHQPAADADDAGRQQQRDEVGRDKDGQKSQAGQEEAGDHGLFFLQAIQRHAHEHALPEEHYDAHHGEQDGHERGAGGVDVDVQEREQRHGRGGVRGKMEPVHNEIGESAVVACQGEVDEHGQE